MANSQNTPPAASSKAHIDAFLTKRRSVPAPLELSARGRLIFAIVATASRARTWSRAADIQSEMFLQTQSFGGLSVQLVYYCGLFEFRGSPWTLSAQTLVSLIDEVHCDAGETRIARILEHAAEETWSVRVNALVLVGDSVEEPLDCVWSVSGKRCLLWGVPVFVFHERTDSSVGYAFREIAPLSQGAYCSCDVGSATQLRVLLAAAAVYAAGGHTVLKDYARRNGGLSARLTRQLPSR